MRNPHYSIYLDVNNTKTIRLVVFIVTLVFTHAYTIAQDSISIKSDFVGTWWLLSARSSTIWYFSIRENNSALIYHNGYGIEEKRGEGTYLIINDTLYLKYKLDTIVLTLHDDKLYTHIDDYVVPLIRSNKRTISGIKRKTNRLIRKRRRQMRHGFINHF
jgi:hypothetical protein